MRGRINDQPYRVAKEHGGVFKKDFKWLACLFRKHKHYAFTLLCRTDAGVGGTERGMGGTEGECSQT